MGYVGIKELTSNQKELHYPISLRKDPLLSTSQTAPFKVLHSSVKTGPAELHAQVLWRREYDCTERTCGKNSLKTKD